MKTKTKWGIGFLGVTVLPIVLELIAALDSNPDTLPWTEYIITYIPYEVTFLVIGGLSFWLIFHFLRWYGLVKK